MQFQMKNTAMPSDKAAWKYAVFLKVRYFEQKLSKVLAGMLSQERFSKFSQKTALYSDFL